MIPVYILIGLLVVVLLLVMWAVGIYNRLVALRNRFRNAFSQIDVQLKRRYDLIPNLVETAKGYMKHERETLEAVIKARQQAIDASGVADQARAENFLTSTLRSLFAVVENYPDLKANQNFLQLQGELTDTEDRIQAARRFYNANVRDMNTRIEVFPSNIIANLFSFRKEEFFELEDAAQRQVPTVDFS